MPNLVLLLSDQSQHLVKLVEDHKSLIYLLSFTLCLVFAIAMAYSFTKAKSEKWMLHFGIAAGLLALQYLLYTIFWYVSEHPIPTEPSGTHPLFQLINQLLSITNNLFFIAAVRNLENKKQLFPNWARVFAAASVVLAVVGLFFSRQAEQGQYESLVEFVKRSADAVFSSITLFIVGRALVTNLKIRRPVLFPISLVVAVLYAGVHIIYWLNPLISRLFGAEDYKAYLSILDAGVIALAFPLKFFLFGSAFFLMLRFFGTLNDLTKLQGEGITERPDYMSSEGVVRLIKTKLDGTVDLAILLPGETPRRVAFLRWPNDTDDNRAIVVNLEDTEDLVYNTLLEDRENLSPNRRAFTVVEPIEAHGTAVGCLKVCRTKYPFSQMAIRQIKAIANLVAPTVQSYRELAALDQLSYRIADKQIEEQKFPPLQATQIIADILHDIFSPEATRFHLDFGFQSSEPIYLGSKKAITAMKKVKWQDWGKVPPEITDESIQNYRLLRKRLTARSIDTLAAQESSDKQEGKKQAIGYLAFAVITERDRKGHPALGTSYLHRKTATTIVADAYFDFARDYFNYLLQECSVNLGKRRVNTKEWFEPIAVIAEKAGAAWVVAATKDLKEIFGEPDAIDIVYYLDDLAHSQDNIILSEENESICYSFSSPQAKANHVIEIPLPISEGRIWLGIERHGLGPELDFLSPWKMFLTSLAQIADSALGRIIFAHEIQIKQIEAVQYQSLASVAAVTGTLVHQLSNMVHGQDASTLALLEALNTGEIIANDEIKELILAMKHSAERARELLLNITKVTKTDDRRPCVLTEAIQQARNLYEVSLLQRNIELDVDVDPKLLVDVPFNVASLALANLIGNAKDAMPKGGRIHIKAMKSGESILCSIIDEGSGIPPRNQTKIFDLGFTTKEGGSGWGLYLTSRYLKENRSEIELIKSDSSGTTFTISFPAHLGEKNAKEKPKDGQVDGNETAPTKKISLRTS